MSNVTNVLADQDPVLVLSATGVGAGTTYFSRDRNNSFFQHAGSGSAVFALAITDVVGVFSAIQVNLEWSPITITGTPQFETVGTWNALANGTAYFPCSATGLYRLNCTSFSGGTSFNVYVSLASAMPQGSGGGGGGGSVTQGTVPWVDNINQVAGVALGATAVVAYGSTPAAVNVPAVNAFVTNAGSIGGGVQFADNAASGATPTGTLDMGWDSVNSKIRALKVDASQNLLVSLGTALPAGTAVIGHVIVDSGAITVSGSVSVSNFPATQIVAGAKTPADSYVNPTDAEDTFALLGGWDATAGKWQRVQVDAATGILKVDPGTVTVTGSVSVSNFPATQPVSGTVNVGNFPATQNITGTTTDGTTTETNFLVVGGESNDATAQYQPIPLGAAGRSVIIEGFAGGTAVPISGSVSVSNFPATQPVSGAVTANQGTAAALSSAWPVQVTDGTHTMPTGDAAARAIFYQITDSTNGPVAVKPASTAPAVNDPALVVAISPNSPISVSASAVSPIDEYGNKQQIANDWFPFMRALLEEMRAVRLGMQLLVEYQSPSYGVSTAGIVPLTKVPPPNVGVNGILEPDLLEWSQDIEDRDSD